MTPPGILRVFVGKSGNQGQQNMQDILTLDVETFSAVDLKKRGAVVYSLDPSTKVLCVGYAFNDEPVQVWTEENLFIPKRVHDHIAKGGEVVAHNSSFERAIWNNVLRRDFGPLPRLEASQLTRDTMLRGSAWGFPSSLDQLALAMNLPFGKDMAGSRVMMQMSKPKSDGTDTHLQDKAKMARLKAYCAVDVELERVIDKLLPLLHKDEAAAWVLDQKMNDRGLLLDLSRIAFLRQAAQAETARLDDEMMVLTAGQVPNCRAVVPLKNWLSDQGVNTSGLAKDDIVELLKGNLPVGARDALLLRQEAAKTSVAKLDSMEAFACGDNRMRHVVQFGGAGRTQRWAGRGPQIQNFPRPHLKSAELEAELAKGKPDLNTISSALRSCIVSDKDSFLGVCDFAQIEARVLAWLAGQQDIVDAFARGDDVYTLTAHKVGSKDRTLGKVLVLACGYGMGPDKFRETAKKSGLMLTEAEAKKNVKTWRDANSFIVGFWYEIGDLMKSSLVDFPNKWLTAKTCAVRVGTFFDRKLHQKVMLFELPSGRYIAYREPEYDDELGVSYMGLSQYTRKWERIRTYGGKAVENITQAIARDLLRDTIKQAELWGLNPLVSIHDEIIFEQPFDSAKDALTILEGVIAHEGPDWADGLPMKGEGFVSVRYGK